MSAYNDKNISLKDIALTQFEMAREMPAAIDLFANKPQNLDIQNRMLAIKVNAVLHNVKKTENFILAIAIEHLAFMNPMFSFLHGDKKESLEIISFDPIPHLKKSKIHNHVASNIESTVVASSAADIISGALKKEGFLIAILNATDVNPLKECIDAFSHDKKGYLLVHNYAV